MAERLVVLIDNDPVLSERLRAVLAAYHLRVEVIHDGNELSLRRDIEPVLIILCIDPKRLGWAICNKIKKATQYRNVPMIVTSHEATDKDFEDHKKLRTRAEEYLHKPFEFEVLLEKVASLIGLDPPHLDESSLEEIPIDDASLIEEEILAPAILAPGATGTGGGAPEGSRPPPHESLVPYIDRQIAEETDAAFAAIGAAEQRRTQEAPTIRHDTLPPRRPSLPGVTTRPEGRTSPPHGPDGGNRLLDEDEIGLTFEDVVTTSVRGSANLLGRGAGPDMRELQQALDTARKQAEQAREAADQAQGEADRWHEERDSLASERDRLTSEREQLASHNEHLRTETQQVLGERDRLASERDRLASEREQAQGEVARLREERDRLRTEADELRAARPSNPPTASATSVFSREREYLNLREVINKKDKELLDLRDAMDSKERQILDARDKGRELDRQRRDLDEKLLEVEREYVAAREKIEALTHDKETGLERERGLKARLDDSQKKLLRADEEIDGWKRRHTADVTRLEEALALEKAQRAHEVKGLKELHGAAIQNLQGEHAAAMQRLQQEHAAALAQRETELSQEQAAALADLDQRHRRVVAELQGQHAAALADLVNRHDEVLTAERAAHAEERDQQEARHRRAQEELTQAHRAELAGLQQRHQQELEAVEARRQQELVAQQQSHEDRSRQLQAEHAAALATQEQAHKGQVASLMAQHRTQMDELTQVLTGERDTIAGRLHDREADLSHTRTHLAEAEAALASLRQRHQDLSTQLDHLQTAYAGLEKENATFQEQVLRAYQRIKSDEGLVSRAKKALAIALTLLDESGAPVVSPAEPKQD